MMVHIPQLLTAEEVAQCRAILEAAAWVDGAGTAGDQAAKEGLTEAEVGALVHANR